MAKVMMSLRVSAETRRQLDLLCARWGEQQSETVSRCIERLYQQEMAKTPALDALQAADYIFSVAQNLDYYGSDATESDIEDYAAYAQGYLSKLARHHVEIEYVDNYPSGDPLYDLRQDVWERFCAQ